MATDERSPSRTAVGVALLRAVHELYDGEPKILSDPVIRRLLQDSDWQGSSANPEWSRTPLMTALRSHVVLRSRYAEDCLQEAVLSGIRQYVILGSGFDTFAYRQPEWASVLRIFEVDHAASQRSKMERLALSAIPAPSNLEFVAADFESAPLRDVLLNASSLDFLAPAFFSCLGVLVYLPRHSATSIFRLIASFPKRSEIVFSFSQGNLNGDQQSSGAAALAQGAAAVGEPWQTYHDPNELYRELSELGFSQVTILSPDEARDRYYRGRVDGLPPPRRATLARAIV